MLGERFIRQENFVQLLVDWAEKNHAEDLDRHMGEYPYPIDFDTEKSKRGQILTWFVLEWKNPQTGTTILEEFLARYIKNPERAAGLRRFGLVLYGNFRIIRHVSIHEVDVVDKSTQKEYRVRFGNKIPPALSFSGYIYPSEGEYHATGVVMFQLPPADGQFITPDMQDELLRQIMKEKQEKVEAAPISATAKLSTYLRNQPVELVTMTAEFLDVPYGKKRERIAAIGAALSGDGADRIIKSLPKKERDCLLYVYRSPQNAVKHGELERRFGNDDFDVFLSERRARSTIGRLRGKGLLMVGGKVMDDKRYKVAVVPAEIRTALDRLAPPEPQNESRPAKKRWRSWFRS